MSELLAMNDELQTDVPISRVFLGKDKKTPVSLSMRRSVLRRIERFALQNEKTRSEAVELLVLKTFEVD